MARSDDYLMGRRDALGDVLMLMREAGMAGRSTSSVVGQVEEMRDEVSLALRRRKDANNTSYITAGKTGEYRLEHTGVSRVAPNGRGQASTFALQQVKRVCTIWDTPVFVCHNRVCTVWDTPDLTGGMMAGVSGRTVEVKLRLPVDLHAVVVARAQASGASRSQVIISMIRDGIAAGSGREPATREDVAALRDQMTALTEFQKAQAIALMDGVRNAIEAAPMQALPSGVPEDEHERLLAARDDEIAVLRGQLKEMHRSRQTSAQALSGRIDEAVGAERERCAEEIELLQGLLADERELSHSLGEQVRSMRGELDAERGRMEDELEKQRGEIGLDGYMRGVEDCRKAGIVKRLLGRF